MTAVAGVTLSSLLAFARAPATVTAPMAALAIADIPVPAINAPVYLVVEGTSGQVLAENNSCHKQALFMLFSAGTGGLAATLIENSIFTS